MEYTFVCVPVNLLVYSKWLIFVSVTSKNFLEGNMRVKKLISSLRFPKPFYSKENEKEYFSLNSPNLGYLVIYLVKKFKKIQILFKILLNYCLVPLCKIKLFSYFFILLSFQPIRKVCNLHTCSTESRLFH